MKKKLVSYFVLACSVFGLTMVGSCKDYDFDVLQDQINYLEQDHVVNLSNKLQVMQDSIDALRTRVAAIKSCTCTGTGTGCSVNCDSLANALDSLYKLLGNLSSDSIGTVIPGYTGGNGLSGIMTYINSQLTNAANIADRADSTANTADSLAKEIAQELKDMRFGWSDSLKKAYDTARLAFSDAAQNKADIAKLADSVENIMARIDSLEALDHHTHTQQFFDSIKTAYETAEKNKERIDSLAEETDKLYALAEQYLDSAKAWADSVANNVKIELSTRIDSVEAQYKRADSIINGRFDAVYDSIGKNYQRIMKLDSTVNALQDSIEAVKARLDEVENKVDKLYDAESRRITSLYVQGAVNPIFGSFALPVGIKSNIIATYYGKATKSSVFPATDTDDLSALLDEGMQLSAAEAAVVGSVDQISTTSGEALAGKTEGNAGRIFLTVNPNEVEIDSTYKFTFVTSDGAETKATIGELVPSTEKLSFGLKTRAGSETGFYEAPVTINAEDAYGLSPKLAVTKEQLKSIAKDIISYKDGINLSGIGSAVFKLAQTELDANAVKVEWSDSLGDHSVTSFYDVAVTAIKPLSYNVLDGVTISKRLPTINNISELSIDLSSIKFDAIEFDSIHFSIDASTAYISFGNVEIDTTGKVSITANVPNHVDPYTGKVDGYDKVTYYVDGLDSILYNVQEAFNGKSVVWQDNVNGAIESLVNKINNEVNSKVNGMFADIEGKLNTPIQNLLDDVKDQVNDALSGYNKYFSKMNSLIDRINSLTNRINKRLSVDLGSYVLPMVAYESANGSLHLMSNDKAIPSKFKAAGGGIKLYLTSYTAELLAPAYKKYIAVVDYVKPDGTTHDASVAKAVNDGNEYFNTVIEGTQLAVPFAPTQKGTYTIYYSAIDYSGFIASGRFYVTVK